MMSKKVLTAVVLAGVMMTSGTALASGMQKILTDRPGTQKEFRGQRPPVSRDERMRPPKPQDERSQNHNNNKRPPMPPRSRDRRPPEHRGVEAR